jgi:hypothetical protein
MSDDGLRPYPTCLSCKVSIIFYLDLQVDISLRVFKEYYFVRSKQTVSSSPPFHPPRSPLSFILYLLSRLPLASCLLNLPPPPTMKLLKIRHDPLRRIFLAPLTSGKFAAFGKCWINMDACHNFFQSQAMGHGQNKFIN